MEIVSTTLRSSTTTYGTAAAWWGLYQRVTAVGSDVNKQLAELQQAIHDGADPDHVAMVRDLIWAPVAEVWGNLQAALARRALRDEPVPDHDGYAITGRTR